MEPKQDEVPAGVEDAGSVVERRRTPRIVVSLDARCRRLGRPDDGDETTTVDVSHGGARITAPAQIAVGDVIALSVEMPHGIELTLQGLVVQLSDGESGRNAHVAFDSLSTAAADLLTELLAEEFDTSASPAEAPGDDAPGADPIS